MPGRTRQAAQRMSESAGVTCNRTEGIPTGRVRATLVRWQQVRRSADRYPVSEPASQGGGQGLHQGSPREWIFRRPEDGNVQGDPIPGQAGADAESAILETLRTSQVRREDLDLRCHLDLGGEAGDGRDAADRDRCPVAVTHQHPAGVARGRCAIGWRSTSRPREGPSGLGPRRCSGSRRERPRGRRPRRWSGQCRPGPP